MPIRHGGMLAIRTSIWPRDHFCRSTIAPRRSRPTTWNEFLPISMPIVAMVAIDLLDMAVLRLTLAPSQHRAREGQEHGRTIPLGDAAVVTRPLFECGSLGGRMHNDRDILGQQETALFKLVCRIANAVH